MAQICGVIQADPNTLAAALNAYSVGAVSVEKTSSAGKFIVVTDSALPEQTFVVITGDPNKLALDINALISGGATIELIIPTFSASHYVVAYV